jgi:hypothetical protein
MQTVVETPSYLLDAERLFSSVERAAIVDRLAADPVCGVMIPGSGGIRKVPVRVRRARKERRRQNYLPVQRRRLPVFILAAFAKNEKANLSAAERNALGKMVDAMVKGYRRQK